MKKTIYFSDREDPRVGFLSNESQYSFVLENRYYPTVEHFLLSKKFEGSAWEEHIRQAPTVFLAKFYATPRKISSRNPKGERVIEDVYGDGKSRYSLRAGWNSEFQKELLKKAITAKFEQNKQLQDKLLETRNIRLIHPLDPLTGEVLEEYRTLLHKKKLKIQTDEEQFSGLLRDLSRKELGQAKEFSNVLIQWISDIAMHFGSKCITKEIIEDVILIATPSAKVSFCMEYVHRFSKVTPRDLYQKLPYMNTLVTHIEDTTAVYHLKDFAKFVPYIYSYVKWVFMESGEESSIIQKVGELQKNASVVVFPPKKRSYRKENNMKKPIELM
jgi:predicted NAD-dependent protein-ADP-ribosyltransferase YbiA (DUF1768 family)